MLVVYAPVSVHVERTVRLVVDTALGDFEGDMLDWPTEEIPGWDVE